MRLIRFTFTFFCAVWVQATQADEAVTVFAAASMGGALNTLAQEYDRPVTLSLGGSGAMARQVAAGAPADLVVLANPAWMAWLENTLPEGTAPRILAGNRLVVVAPSGAALLNSAADLPGLGRLAMGQRDAVPAGVYAQQWLRHAGLWEALQPQLVETDNVRAALALVARGEVEAGIVYTSDALSEPKVTVVLKVSEDAHDPILYPAAALTAAGADFLDHLLSPTSQDALVALGFKKVTP